jgi:hypothetical protein
MVNRTTDYLVAASGGRLQTWPITADIIGDPIDGPTIGTLAEHLAVSRDGRYVAVPEGSTVSVYRWDADHVGTLVASVTLPGAARGIAWSPDGAAIAIAHTTTPFVSVYRWTSAGFGTQYTNPATLPTGNARAVAFHQSGAALAVAHTTSPFVSAYPFNTATGFGTKYANPATLPGANAVDVRFRPPSGGHVVVLWNGNPGFAVYPFTVASGFGAKLADPGTGAAQTGDGCDWSRDGQVLGIGGGAADAYFYSLASGALGNVTTFTPGATTSLRFSPGGAYVAFFLSVSPYLAVYRYSPTPSLMQPLAALPSVSALAGPLVWGATGGVAPATGNHPVAAPVVLYAAAAPGDWGVEVPLQVARALDLLASQVAGALALLDYIVAQTGIVPPDQAAMPFPPSIADAMRPPSDLDTMQPTPQ